MEIIKKMISKYEKSIDNWIFPIPLLDGNKMFLRVYMSRKGEKHFYVAYTYKTNKSDLIKFFNEDSWGQAYWKYFRNEGKRSDYLECLDKTEGYWEIKDLIEICVSYHTETIMKEITNSMKHSGMEFNTNHIEEKDRTTAQNLKYEKELEEIIKKQEQEFMMLGGDY